MNDKQRGRFFVTNIMVQDHPEQVAKILSMMEFVPCRVEHLWDRRQFEYIGISSLFEETPDQIMTPTYQLRMFDEKGELVKVEVTKVDD